MAEFTGERVIPELVDADLLNEHLARYRFARHFAAERGTLADVLDAGCGSGYGTAVLAGAAARITGTDISKDAVEYARERYGNAGIRFLPSACEALPFVDGVFDLVTAFEVIEHLDRRRELLNEANRVLKPSGVLLVSTPNRDSYAESRGAAGPNPFHRHEFDYEEFRHLLCEVFPFVQIWTQNHAEAIVFSPPQPESAELEAAGSNDFASAHFYLAACSRSPITNSDVFAWIPSTANVLQERERHISKLAGELEKKDAWLQQAVGEHAELQRQHEALMAELEHKNQWAAELDREIEARKTRIQDLQHELDVRLTWVSSLESELEQAGRFRVEAQAAIERLETTVVERTAWAQRLDREVADYRAEREQVRSSKWFRLGAKLGFGPRLRDDK